MVTLNGRVVEPVRGTLSLLSEGRRLLGGIPSATPLGAIPSACILQCYTQM